MTSGNGAEWSGEARTVGPTSGSSDDSADGSDDCERTAVEPAPPVSPDRPSERRRKVGVQYRPV